MGKPIRIEGKPGRYTVTVEGLGAVCKLGGKLEVSTTGKPATFGRERAWSLAHTIGRYKLGLGDFVTGYTDSVVPMGSI